MKNNKISFIVILLLSLSLSSAIAQNDVSTKGYKSLGLGIGLPYGGIGGRFGINVVDQLNLFAGLGYNLAGAGYNFGALYSIPSQSNTEFYFTAMYGANASTKVDGASEYTGTYTGPTIGIGLKIASKRNSTNYFDLGVLLPFRSSEYEQVIDDIKNDPRVQDLQEPWPVVFVIAYNFGL